MLEALNALLAAHLRGEAREWPPGLRDIPLAELWERISYHGVAPLIAPRVRADDSWPAPLRDRLLEEARMQAFWEETHRAALVELFGRLGAAGVEALVMKGTALAYTLYPDPAARRRGDTDLLVREGDLDKVRQALKEQGFVRRVDPHGLQSQETWLFDTDIGIIHPIDLHWQPNDSAVLQQVLRLDEFFAGARPVPRLAGNAAAPDPVCSFLQCALNQAWHREHGYLVEGRSVIAQGRLIWAWDNHLLASSLTSGQWDRIAGLASERGVARFVLEAIRLCERELGTAIPEGARERLLAAPQETDVVRSLLEKDRIAASLQDLRAIPSIRGKLGFVLDHAFPSARHLRLKYPQASAWPVPLLHIRRLFEIARRWRGAKP